MARINTELENFEIKHPDMPELIVHCLAQDPIEAMDLMSSLSKYQRAIPLIDPRTDQLVEDKKGNPVTVTITVLPGSEIIKILSQVVKRIDGLEDKSGNKLTDVKHLFNPGLNIKRTTTSEGNPSVTSIISFADYIQEEINKRTTAVVTAENVDPKAQTSPTRA